MIDLLLFMTLLLTIWSTYLRQSRYHCSSAASIFVIFQSGKHISISSLLAPPGSGPLHLGSHTSNNTVASFAATLFTAFEVIDPCNRKPMDILG